MIRIVLQCLLVTSVSQYMTYDAELMRETEVQSFVSLVGGSGKVVLLLFRAHSVPGCFSLLIHTQVEKLGADEKADVVTSYSDKNLVAATIERLVIIAIDLCFLDVAVTGKLRKTYV